MGLAAVVVPASGKGGAEQLRVLLHDEHLLLAWKPKGLQSQRRQKQPSPFELELRKATGLSASGGARCLVNAVEGVEVLGATEETARLLGKMDERGEIRSRFHAVVAGYATSGVLEGSPGGRTQVTVLRTADVSWFGELSLVELEPLGPRAPMQLRRHLAAAGTKVLGNTQATQRCAKGKGTYLVRTGVSFTHPVSGLPVVFQAAIPSRLLWLFDEYRHKPRPSVGLPPTEETVRFAGIDVTVPTGVFFPRASSEALVQAAIRFLSGGGGQAGGEADRQAGGDGVPLVQTRAAGEQPCVLDIGTGSGALLLGVLAAVPGATGVAVDCCERAVAAAQRNAVSAGLGDRVNVEMRRIEDLTAKDAADVVLCNPPYLGGAAKNWEYVKAQAGVGEELGTFAGEDGNEFYHLLVSAASRGVVKRDGVIIVEVPSTRSRVTSIRRIWQDAGWIVEENLIDSKGRRRGLVLRRAGCEGVKLRSLSGTVWHPGVVGFFAAWLAGHVLWGR
eukprot:CAMPEP_0204327604 /NCGR_PEP_ID=MMETSP0469-20131031/12721_1 /ASSEMBLY_ACC=CAM_ASM_000384 /TAXON_ID=2969 /ORGANISM="Oxyrrhis marina" /LENGTH=502 /DNA_ID=CAMNT_0051309865 /DNA_START=40 /DNA_END=1546 /DNA_ORIENTATION=-